MKYTLALDLGTNTGWAMGHGTGLIASGTQSFKPRRFDGGGMRFLRFRQFLDQMRLDNSPTSGIAKVVFEEVRAHQGVDAAHVYGGLMATLTAWCEEKGIPYEGIPVGTIKKAACGKGNANKEAMIEACRALGYDPVDDNEADAIHLYRYVTQ